MSEHYSETVAAMLEKISGLTQEEAKAYILKGVEDIAICPFSARDVVRHPLVQRIIAAYDKYEKTQEGQRNLSHGKDQSRH